MRSTNPRLGTSPLRNTLTRTGHAAVEVHAIDTNRRVVLDTEINVFADTEAEVASLREVALAELVFLDLEATLEDLNGLLAADGDVDSDLFVATDAEGTDGVAGLSCFDQVVSISCSSLFLPLCGFSVPYSRLGFDQTAARAPLRHE